MRGCNLSHAQKAKEDNDHGQPKQKRCCMCKDFLAGQQILFVQAARMAKENMHCLVRTVAQNDRKLLAFLLPYSLTQKQLRPLQQEGAVAIVHQATIQILLSMAMNTTFVLDPTERKQA